MKLIKVAGAIIALLAAGSFAHAEGRIFTASVNEKGQATAQSPKWVKEVALIAQPEGCQFQRTYLLWSCQVGQYSGHQLH